MEFTAKRRDMAYFRTIPYKIGRGELYIIGECEGKQEFIRITNLQLRSETKPEPKTCSRKSQKGDNKMHKFRFKFLGGAKKVEQANYKFHAFIVDTNSQEHHLYGALKNGLVEQMDQLNHIYTSATPVIKVFSATAGFGIPKEFFSYFIMLSPSGTKQINIKPLGFKNISGFGWSFSGVGRFMKKEEVRRFFGASSDTWKFYQRQSFLSRQRLSELVTITDASPLDQPLEERVEEVRMLRFD